MVNMKYFEYKHLPNDLKPISKLIHDTAHTLNTHVSNNAEKQAGMRKLLEAKDCFVRANLI